MIWTRLANGSGKPVSSSLEKSGRVRRDTLGSISVDLMAISMR